MLKAIKTDRVVQAALAGVVVVGSLACCMWGFWALRYFTQSAAVGPAPPAQPAPLAQAPPAEPTATPPPTATPQSTARPTATTIPLALPTADEEWLKSFWGTVDIRDLAKNPDRYIEAQVHYTGTVFSIEEDDRAAYMQVKVPIPGGSEYDTEFVVVVFQGTTDGIYEDTKVEFWGRCKGAFEGENAFGGYIRQPLIMAEYLTYFTQ